MKNFAIVVFTCTRRVLQEMLPYSEEKSFSFKTFEWLSRAGQCASVLRSMTPKNGFRCMLLNSLLAQKLINNVALA